ncbi:MAG: permease prefix domain 1-containing protein, partial [Planctomycetaceae bacterium]|nr:permease prefix domain 1-containing protein [Planctomycetaceae bacterium]
MNEKLRNHINILFAAAPKNRKAEELKEELLTNLNDKYDDLLKSGYDSTSAFHIALSGIGDIDELFRECRESAESSGPVQNGRTTNSQTTVGQNEKPGASNDSATPVPKTTSSGCLLTPLLLAIAIGLFVLGPGLVVFFSDLSGIDVSPRNVRVNGIHVSPGHVKIESLNRLNDIRIGVMMMFASWAAGIGLIVYLIVRAVKNSYCDREKPHACSRPNSGTTPFSQTQ